MAAAAAAVAARPPKVKEPSNNKALILFVGGIVALAGAVGYAKWAALSAETAIVTAKPKPAAQATDAQKLDTLITEKEKKEEDAIAEQEAKKQKKADAVKEIKQPFADSAESNASKKGKNEDEGKKTTPPQPTKEASIQPLVNALKKVANVNTKQLDIETDVSRRPYFAGHHIFAKTVIEKDSPVISLTGALQFSVRSVDQQLQKGLAVLVHHAGASQAVRDHLANSPYYNITTLLPKLHDTDELFNTADPNAAEIDETAPAPSSALDGDLHLLMLSLVLERRKEKKSKWWPWIESLPPIEHLAVNHGMFVTDEEFARCLPKRGQRIVNDMRLEMRWVKNATAEVCKAKILNLEPKLDAFREQQRLPQSEVKNHIKFSELERAAIMARYLVCEVTSAELEWAYAIITARSHLVGNVRTIFPLVDVLPYAVTATIKPGQIQASEEGKIIAVEFIAARDIDVDEPLSFRTSIREPIEAVLAQGFFDTDFFTDNNVPIGIFYHFDEDAKRFNNLDLGEQTGIHCGQSFQARSIPEYGGVPREMLLCSELAFLKTVTNTADEDAERLSALRSELINQFLSEPSASNETNGKISPVSQVDGALISSPQRNELRSKATEFILAAVENTIKIYSTKDSCAEDARAFLGEVQAHNDYALSILEKTKKALVQQ